MKLLAIDQSLRPREKLLQSGADTLTDAELLAIFLRTGLPGCNAIELAQSLIHQFGGLRPLLLSDQATFCQAKGIGTAKYVQLQACLEMAKRHMQQATLQSDKLSSPLQVVELLNYQLRDQSSESFAAVFLNNQHRIIHFEILFHGTINQTHIQPREIIRRCLHHNAAAMIFSHNHPSGDIQPSQADIIITQKLIRLLSDIDITVLDHIIIGNGKHYSMATEYETKGMFL